MKLGWPRQIVFVRHGESEGNVLTVEQRVRNKIPTHVYELTDRGKAQAKQAGDSLRGMFGWFDVHFTSYYERAKQTLQLMYPDLPKHKVIEDPRLREIERGIWAFYTEDEIKQHFPMEIERKAREGEYHYRPPGGQNWPDVEERIQSLLFTLRNEYEDQNVLLVGHAHWLVLLERVLERFEVGEAIYRHDHDIAPNCSATVYDGIEFQHGRGSKRIKLRQALRHHVLWENL